MKIDEDIQKLIAYPFIVVLGLLDLVYRIILIFLPVINSRLIVTKLGKIKSEKE